MSWRLGVRTTTALAAAVLLAVGATAAGAQPAGSDKSAIYLYQGADRDARLRREGARGRHAHALHVDGDDRVRSARASVREEIRHQGPALAGAERERAAARADRGAQRAPGARRGRDQCARGRSAGARAGGGRVLQPAPCRSARLGDAAAPALGGRSRQSVGGGLQHRQGEARGAARRPTRALPIRNGRAASRSRRPTAIGCTASSTSWASRAASRFSASWRRCKPDLRKGHALLAQLVAAGELPIALTTYSGNAELIKAKGGPIDWVAVEPLVGRPQALAVAKNAPHPHAALLFVDFVLSPEGMKLLNDLGRVPRAAARRRCSTGTSTSWSIRSNGSTRRPDGRRSGASCS